MHFGAEGNFDGFLRIHRGRMFTCGWVGAGGRFRKGRLVWVGMMVGLVSVFGGLDVEVFVGYLCCYEGFIVIEGRGLMGGGLLSDERKHCEYGILSRGRVVICLFIVGC